MRSVVHKSTLLKASVAAFVLAFASAAAMAQSTVTLTAGPTSTTLPDGQTVPMWGYTCGDSLAAPVASVNATCTSMTGAAQVGGTKWQPPLITIASGQSLVINLVNNLAFTAPVGGASTASIPTSLVIDGQLGGGLGSAPSRVPSPTRSPQGTTWPGTAGGTASTDPVFTPPAQADRVRSFGTEVAAGKSQELCWGAACPGTGPKANLRPGTYIIHSGTQPSIQHPMGLYGVLVVTDASYPGQTYDKDVALLLSEIDPVQNIAVDTAVHTDGFTDKPSWSAQAGECGDPAVHKCYPPAVNYSPLYFLINGLSFDRSNADASAAVVAPDATQGRVLLRFANAGLRMHIPSVVGKNLTLLAEDGNKAPPGTIKVQSSLFLPAGKTFDATIQPTKTAPASVLYASATYAVFDRALGLSANNQRDGGMHAYIKVAGGSAPANVAAVARPDTYYLVGGNVLAVAEAAKGLIANDTGVYGVSVLTPPTGGTLSLNADGTFTYTPNPSTSSDSFTYCGNGTTTGAACSTVTLASCAATAGCVGGAPTASPDTYNSNVASLLQIAPPGVLSNDTDPKGFPLKASTLASVTGGTVSMNPDGSFTAVPTCAPACSAASTVTFQYTAVNSQNTASSPATVTVNFAAPSNLQVAIKDGKTNAILPADYRWIIEEDRTMWIDPTIETKPRCTSPGVPAGCSDTPVRNAAINFHVSHTPVVAQGCVGTISCESGQTVLNPLTGSHDPAVCDIGNGGCRPGVTKTEVAPSQVHLDPTKRYYLSVLPGDGANPVTDGSDGHTMGGVQIAPGQIDATVFVQRTPLEPAKVSIFVFQDDAPLNGEVDTGGGVDVLAPNEPGLGGFNVVLLDQAGGFGDSTGQLTYDMFGMPVSNSLAGRIDPATGRDACPISPKSTDGLVGMIVTCPKYEGSLPSDTAATPKVLSPLAGHAIVANMYPGIYEAMISPGADRIARGEEWLQTNTLDGTKAIEAFLKAGEPAYFQEFGPGGFHIAMGFANPKIINARKAGVCAGAGVNCTGNFYGQVTTTRLSRTPDQRVYSSGSYDSYSFTQCYVSLGSPDFEDFAFAKCDENGRFEFTNIPTGNLRVTVFDQWNDLLVDGLSTPIKAAATGPGSGPNSRMEIPVTQWRTNLYGRVFIDTNGDGVSQESEPGLPLVPYNIRFRDGSYVGFNNTDLAGYAAFNEVFPFLNWLVVDIDSARYKLSGVHVVYDAGGPVDGTTGGGNSTIAAGFANTIESASAHLPPELRVPGSIYCADADCIGAKSHILGNPSTGRVDPGWASTQGWLGLLGNNSFIEFAMKPFKQGENGGIRGHVIYTSTRPFDDPALLLQLSWEPGVPNVKINLYREDVASDGTKTLKLVDTTTTTSFDDYAQGFRKDAAGNLVRDTAGKAIPNMNCPGQETSSPFYFTMIGDTFPLDPTNTALAQNGRFRCYDGWSMLAQVQPVPYNGMYKFPSIINRNAVTGAPIGVGTDTGATGSRPGSNCTICVANPDDGTPMLPAGKYVVEVIVPQGYELVKEEDKNILLGDAFIAPAPQQFAGFGNIFIMPDQAAVNAFYNPTNTLQRTTNNGATPRREGDTGSVEVFWPCVGTSRIVPDLISLFPGVGQQAPFAGATRPLCDRKEVTLNDEMTALAKFYIFSSTHVTGHFTGTITNDFAAEFDPFSPQFGEKFAVPNVPVALRDFSGKEISRVYADQWGIFNGITFSTYTVNPPSPSGYVPQVMLACMNDPGPIPDPANPGQMIQDPTYNPAYSNFCYEWTFMPGQTAYLDTPVIPTMAFAAGYNLPDCEYPDTTPAIKSVLGTSIPGGSGPWVSAAGQSLTINALGDKPVLNHAYSGPMSTTAPFNKKFVTRHYGFGSRPPTCPVSGACPNVTIGGVPMNNVATWNDSQIVGDVPTLSTAQSACTLAQRGVSDPEATNYRCGQLEITAGNGKKSIDTVTVTIAGKTPTYVTPASPSVSTFGHIEPNPLQTAIDQATPGDLIIVGPGTYKETLLVWKPVRLQGVGADSVTINADAHPAGKMDAYRRQLNCLFGMSLEGRPLIADGAFDASTFDPSGTYSCPASMQQRVDRIPAETIIGWDTTGNGNLAQMLQEPTLMGAYEGAGFTVLGRGIRIPSDSSDFWGSTTAGGFPNGYAYLGTSTADCDSSATLTNGRDYGTSNFLCNPSSIDGFSVINSSQGGGAILAHAWNHNLMVSNNRVHGNHGTLTGGITIGWGEFPDPFMVGGEVPLPANLPANGLITGQQAGYGFNRNVNVHHNSVTANASIGDALYSGTNSAAGGVSFCTGADGYKFNYNWVCGNLSTGDAGGVSHIGFINDATISHNSILFNQTASATIPTNGGGLAILGASPDRSLANGAECGSVNDADCPPGLPEGTGRNLVIDANLIVGNSAESGTGGGIRLQMVNGQDVIAFPRLPGLWNDVTLTNNIITNNVAGWDGGGVSIQDALKVKFVNNTVMSNDTTGSAGVLFNTLGAPLAAVPPPGCSPQTDPSLPQDPSCINPVPTSTNQPAGLASMQNTPNLIGALATLPDPKVICPAGNSSGTGATLPIPNGDCLQVSYPQLLNNIIWQNRAFHVEVTGMGTGLLDHQSVVTLVPSLNQTATGLCVTTGTNNGASGSGDAVNYWDIGVRGDSGPTNHGSGYTLEPRFSILSSGGYGGSNIGSNPNVVKQYCNGARIPPENCAGVAAIDQARCKGFNAPAGQSEYTGLPVVFALNQVTAAATVDEGNNWINLGYGPLALNNPSLYTSANTELPMLGNYGITVGSPARNGVNNSGTGALAYAAAPPVDFFGTARKTNNTVDIGAVEYVVPAPTANVSGGPLAFGDVVVGAVSATKAVTLATTGAGNITGIGLAFSTGFSRSASSPGSCPTTATFSLTAGNTCTINVVFRPTAVASVVGTLTISASVPVAGSPVGLSGTGVAPPSIPSLGLLDNFNRANATSLGANWAQVTSVGGGAAIRIASNQASCSGLLCMLGGYAYWNATTFGSQQGAAMTFTGSASNGSALLLKVSGGNATLGANGIRVRYNAGTVTVETTINSGAAFTTQGSFAATVTTGQTLTATVNNAGQVSVFVNSTFAGSVQLPNDALWTTGGGRIGIQVPSGTTTVIDNFTGGNF